MSHLITAGHPHTVLELHHGETIIPAPNLEAHPQAGPVEQFQESHSIIEQSAGQVVDRGPQCP
jgi:hypothetical protein